MTRPDHRSPSKRSLHEWLLLLASLGMVGAALGYTHLVDAERADANERDRLQVLTALVANNIQVNLTMLDQVVEGVVQDYLSAPSTLASSHFLTLRLKALEAAIPGARALLVLDADGRVTHSSQQRLDGLDLSYRDYYREVRRQPSASLLYLSAPYQSFKPEHDMVVAASRMVPDGDGKFAGQVVAVLGKEYFSQPFSMGIYAPDVWAVVVQGSGRQIMNFPEDPRLAGRGLNETIFQHHLARGQPEAMIRGQITAGGPLRLMSLRTIRPPSLRMSQPITVGLSRELDVMALPLQRQAAAFGVLYSLLVLSCGGGLLWMQKRRTAADTAAAALERELRAAEQDKRLLKAGRESEQRFRTLIEDAPLAVAILRGGHFIYTNPRYRDLHGYHHNDDLTGLPWSAMIMPEARATLSAQEALISADSASEQKFETQGLGKHGTPVPVFKTTTRVELIDGPATLIFAQDISAQKAAEHALLRARDVAEAASRSKADFLANMSHEIRSPLNAILGLAYLLDQSPLTGDAHGMVRKLQGSGRMLLGIINDILDVSKIESGHMQLEQISFRLDSVIDNLAATMGVAVGEKDIELILHPLPAGIATLVGDPLRLQQILANLTSNAIKFTATGQVELRVDVLARQERQVTLRFTVTDTGIGIAAAQHDEVFSAFTQADSSTTRNFGGTGLGLTISRRLVALMGGDMGLHSVPGEGSAFWFSVPLQSVPDSDFSSPEMVQVEALIADDSELQLAVIGNIASSLGWQVSGYTSGQELLSRLCARPREGGLPSVIILDWKMPDMDGLETARAIRSALSEDECPIVIMATASSLALIANQPGAELVDAVLNKPVTASALYNAMVEARQRRAATGSLPAPATREGLQGVRLLVVDDSDINRDVAQRILQAQGATVALAVDGRDALDWLGHHADQVDLVLMDVQMPVMDGIEATRQLRAQPRFAHLPIVALTAGAFKSQQEAARAAGMSHFISKPFDVPNTIALIQRLLRNGGGGSGSGEDLAAADGSHAAPLAGPQVIDLQRGLQVCGDSATYQQYLRQFAAGYAGLVERIHASLGAGDGSGAAALAHQLAGVAGNIGLPEIHRLALDAEQVLAAEHEPTLALERLAAALTAALDAIARYAPAAPAAAPQAASALTPAAQLPAAQRAELQQLLHALLAALDSDNPDPAEIVLHRLMALRPVAELTPIQAAVRAFDFRGAEALTVALAAELGAVP